MHAHVLGHLPRPLERFSGGARLLPFMLSGLWLVQGAVHDKRSGKLICCHLAAAGHRLTEAAVAVSASISDALEVP